MRAKLRVESVDNNAVIMNVIRMDDDEMKKNENKKTFSDTPSGRLHFNMTNDEISKNVKVGDMYYADFTKVPAENAHGSQAPGSGTKEQDKR